MRPTSRQTTMVGPTQGGDGLGLGRGGGWYRRRLERDFGIRRVPFPGRRPSGLGRAATTNDRTLAGRLTATVALVACLCLAGCGGGGSGAAKGGTAAPAEALGARPLVARNQSQFQGDLDGLRGRVVVVNFWASWCATALPQTWFVARDGSRAGRIAGRLQVDDLRSRVDELLGGS